MLAHAATRLAYELALLLERSMSRETTDAVGRKHPGRWPRLAWLLSSHAATGAARWLLAIVFLAASAPKLWRLEDFAIAVHNYQLLPAWLVGAAAVVLPGIEAAAGVALFFKHWRAPAAWLAVGLCCAFVVAVAAAIVRGLDIECGCFSAFVHRQVGYGLLAQDLALLALAVYCAVAQGRGGHTRHV